MMRKLTRKMGLLCSLGLLFTGMHTYGQYCIPSSLNGCDEGDDVNTFILNGEGGTSLNTANTGCSLGAYDDLTTLAPVDLMPGLNYTATVSSEYYDPIFVDGDFCAIWIDLDNNGTFESSEQVGGTNTYILDSGSPVTISIPGAATSGNRRMRVVVAYGVLIEDMDPCNAGANTWDYGEVHDYMVNILPPPACPFPTGLTAVASGNGATVSWGGAGSFVLEYGPEGYTPGTGAAAGTNGTLISPAVSPQAIPGLSNGTYDIYIRQDCGASGFSINMKAVFATNDECGRAIALSGGSALATSTTGANESMTPCGSTSTALDTWYKVTAGSAGDITLTATPDGGADVVMEVFSGDCSAPVSLACVDNSFGTETYTITGATANTTYYMRVYDFNGGQVSFNLQASGAPLPVVLDQLSGRLLAGNLAQLSWTTFMEKNNKGFDVQRSEDGRTFSSIGWVSTQTEGGNSSQALRYQFTDKIAISDAAYYRLQQVDRDGKATLSNIVRLGSQTESSFNIIASPNPVAGDLAVRIKGDRSADAMLYITDISGKVVMQAPVTAAATIVNMAGLAKGIYLLKYTDSSQSKTLKVTRQ